MRPCPHGNRNVGFISGKNTVDFYYKPVRSIYTDNIDWLKIGQSLSLILSINTVTPVQSVFNIEKVIKGEL